MPLFTWYLMMKHLWISWLFFGCLSSAMARDPFAQLSPSCLSSAMSLENWRLQGMVGKGSRYLGWLRSPQGERVAIASDRPSPFVDWQIEDFTPFRLTLNATRSCAPQRVTLQIKGRYHDPDRRGAAVDKRRSTGQ